MIIPYKDKKHKQRKFYCVPRRAFFTNPQFDTYNFEFLETFENQLTFVRTIYRRLPSEQKIDLMIKMCHTLLGARIYFETNNLATFGKTVKTGTHRRIRDRCDELFAILYEIINSDMDAAIILMLLQTDPLYQYVPDPKIVDDALDKYFKNIKKDREDDVCF
ncbi:MAG: hypothetical protein EX285_03110 [Thaumarchaeota archaeon]|nr:hypothetical protein [Nitrososphaerota archaeon]